MRCEIGVDIVAMTRIQQAVDRFGERFLKRIYTEDELEYALSDAHKWEHLAARFAAKEAASKALGTGMVGVGWKDFAVERLRSGKPLLRLSGRAAQVAQEQGLRQWSVSLAHDAEAKVAVATVVAWGAGPEDERMRG
jgi:holo-[acyl-carrier protein] synthase